jgi:hypothetical protein
MHPKDPLPVQDIAYEGGREKRCSVSHFALE